MISAETMLILLRKYCPHTHNILSGRKDVWIKLAKKFSIKLELAEKAISKEGFVMTENSIPVLLGNAQLGNRISIAFLYFIDSEIKYLFEAVDTNLKNSVQKLLIRLLLEFDNQTLLKPNPTYLNGLSEILTINKLIKSDGYVLDCIEFKLPNKKTADFRLVNKGLSYIYVEIYNLHIDSNKVNDFSSFKLLLDNRIQNKLMDKTIGLDDDHRKNFMLVPIIWADHLVTKHINKYVKIFEESTYNVSKPCGLMQFEIGEKKGFYFGTYEAH